MRIIDNTANPTAWPMLFDVYRTHRDELVAVAFSFRSSAEDFYKQAVRANDIRATHGITSFATRLYRIRIKKFKAVGVKP